MDVRVHNEKFPEVFVFGNFKGLPFDKARQALESPYRVALAHGNPNEGRPRTGAFSSDFGEVARHVPLLRYMARITIENVRATLASTGEAERVAPVDDRSTADEIHTGTPIRGSIVDWNELPRRQVGPIKRAPIGTYRVEFLDSGRIIPDQELPRRAAFFAAGPAVIAAMLGWRVTSVPAGEGDRKPISFEMHKDTQDYDTHLLHEELILIHLASFTAEQRAYGNYSDPASKDPAKRAQDVADAAGLDDANAYLPEAAQLVSYYWRGIEVLADRILRLKKGELLSEDELKAIMDRSRPSRAERRRFEREFGPVREGR
jgi:hypothetical protein